MTATTRRWIRIAFAGPGAVLIALIMMAGMALWLPGGAAGIDNLVLPLILAPLLSNNPSKIINIVSLIQLIRIFNFFLLSLL